MKGYKDTCTLFLDCNDDDDDDDDYKIKSKPLLHAEYCINTKS